MSVDDPQIVEGYSDEQGAADLAHMVANCFDSADGPKGRRACLDQQTPQLKGL
jgi:hypothetical protein